MKDFFYFLLGMPISIYNVIKNLVFFEKNFSARQHAVQQDSLEKVRDLEKKYQLAKFIGVLIGLLVSLLLITAPFFSIPSFATLTLGDITLFVGSTGIVAGICLLFLINAACRFVGALIGQWTMSNSKNAHAVRVWEGQPHVADFSQHLQIALQFAFYGTTPAHKRDSSVPKVDGRWLWKYIISPLLIAGLFVMFAFGLFGQSFLSVPGQFLMKGILAKPLWSLSFIVIPLSILVHLMIRGVKREVVDTPVHRALLAALKAEELLNAYENSPGNWHLIFNHETALRSYLEQVSVLLLPKTPLASYPGGSLLHQRDSHRLKQLLATKPLTLAWLQECREIMLHINGSPADENGRVAVSGAIIDPDGRVPLEKVDRIGLPLVATSLLIGCVTMLYVIFSGVVNAYVPWLLQIGVPSAAAMGFFAWVTIRHIVNRTSGGPYSQMAALTGILAIILLTLAILPLLLPTAGVLSITLGATIGLSIFGIISTVACVISIGAVQRYIKKGPDARVEESRSNGSPWYEFWQMQRWRWNSYHLARRALLVVKFFVAVGSLLLVLLSIATLFNLKGLGEFSQLMDFAFKIIGQAIGGGGYGIGANWLSVFCISILATAGFILFTVIKDLHLISAASVTDLKAQQQDNVRKLVGQIGKLVFFTTGLVVVLYDKSTSGAFLPGSRVVLFFPFLFVMTIMPLFSGNASLPDFEIRGYRPFRAINNLFNNIGGFGLGIKPLPGKRQLYLLRELIVLSLLSIPVVVFALIGGLTPAIGLILGIGIGVTMVFRGIKQWVGEGKLGDGPGGKIRSMPEGQLGWETEMSKVRKSSADLCNTAMYEIGDQKGERKGSFECSGGGPADMRSPLLARGYFARHLTPDFSQSGYGSDNDGDIRFRSNSQSEYGSDNGGDIRPGTPEDSDNESENGVRCGGLS